MSAMPPLSLSTACLTPLALPKVARAAANAGYDGLELVLGPDYLRHGAAWLRHVLCGAPLPVRSVHQPLYHIGRWQQPAQLVAETVDVALLLHAQVAVFHSPWSASWEEAYARAWLAALEAAQARSASHGLRLTVENMGAGRPAPTVLSELKTLASFCRERGLGLTYDTCHAGTLGADLVADLNAVNDVLANVHLSDYRPQGPFQRLPVLDMLAANHQLPGEGALALDKALQALVKQSYTGPITFEVSPLALYAYLPGPRRARLSQALGFARRALDSAAIGSQPMPVTVPAE